MATFPPARPGMRLLFCPSALSPRRDPLRSVIEPTVTILTLCVQQTVALRREKHEPPQALRLSCKHDISRNYRGRG
jgi:hypothetical protein